MTYPTIRVQKGHDKRLRDGSPWIFSNELRIDDDAKALAPGSLVRVMAPSGKIMGVGQFNPHSLIALRMLTRNKDAVIDEAFLARRLERALALRQRLFASDHYRLVHAEGDGLPGFVIDRFGPTLVVQVNTAGIEMLETELLGALETVLEPTAIVLRNDTPAREREGLGRETRVVKGTIADPTPVDEDGLPFLANLGEGQKTGWYFDQRLNRRFLQRVAKDARMLDLYSYAGGFALAAIAAGAKSAHLVDRSELALDLAKEAAARHGVGERVSVARDHVFEAIDTMAAEKRRFDLVMADPPAFVKSRKELGQGLRGYRKLARGTASLVAEGGFLAIACCSHNVEADAFRDEVSAGIKAAGRGGRLLHSAGAAPDHPVHPALAETAYLKFLVFALD